jgi:hypothetical protein
MWGGIEAALWKLSLNEAFDQGIRKYGKIKVSRGLYQENGHDRSYFLAKEQINAPSFSR